MIIVDLNEKYYYSIKVVKVISQYTLVEELSTKPMQNLSSRAKRKLTDEITVIIDNCLEKNEVKS